MNKALLEIIFLALCFIAITIASILIYQDEYGSIIVKILGGTLFALFIYIILKLTRRIK